MTTLGSFVLLRDSFGDIFGERRVFALGVDDFGATSLLCAVASTIGLLVSFRALQGIVGALLTPSSLAGDRQHISRAGTRPWYGELDGVRDDRRSGRSARR